jgi:hypothetical protein
MSRTIRIEDLAHAHDLNAGELEQLQEWIRRVPDLVQAEPGILFVGPANKLIGMIRNGWLASVPPAASALPR